MVFELSELTSSIVFLVYLGVRTCELFSSSPYVFLSSFVLTSLITLFYVTREFKRF